MNKTFEPFSLKSMAIKNKWHFIILAFLVFISYFNSLNNSFVSDDRGILVNARSWNLDSVFSQPLSFVRRLEYFVLYELFGLNPFFFRIINIIFHLGSVFLIFLLISFITKPRIGFLTASLFAVHPILIESVTWISGGIYIQYAFFFLFSLLFYLNYKKRKLKKDYIFSIVLFSLSLFSSEKAFVLFIIFFLYELSFGNLKNNWKKLIPFFFLTLIIAILYLFYFGKLNERIILVQQEDINYSAKIDNPLIQVPIAVTSYFELIIWPQNLTIYHSEMSFGYIEYIIRFLIFAVFIFYLIYSFWQNKKIFFFLSFFLVTLLPTLMPFKFSWIVAERYVYLGSIGIFAFIAEIFSRLIDVKKIKFLIITLFIFLIIGFSIRTIVRNVDWENEDNLWIATGKTSPSSPNNHNNLGDVYGRQGNLEMALFEFQTAIKLKPNYADAYHNLANTYVEIGKIDEAINNYKKAIEFNSSLWQSYRSLAAIYFQKNEFDLALSNLKSAILLNPNDLDLQTDLGLIYLKSGNKVEAKEIFTKILSIDSGNQKANIGLNEANK